MASETLAVSLNAAANAIAEKDFIEVDGSGAIKAFDGTGVPIGIAISAKDGDNLAGVILGRKLMKITSVAAAYEIGDALEADSSQRVLAQSSGTTIGIAVESKTTSTGDLDLLCVVNFN